MATKPNFNSNRNCIEFWLPTISGLIHKPGDYLSVRFVVWFIYFNFEFMRFQVKPSIFFRINASLCTPVCQSGCLTCS